MCIVTDRPPWRILGAVIAASVMLGVPSIAEAHGGTSAPAATDDQAMLRSVAPPVAGLRVAVLDGDQSLWVAGPPDASLVVFGLANEAFLRLAHGVAEVNDRSAEAHLVGLAAAGVAMSTDPAAPPRWRAIGDADHLQWHEHRLAAPLGAWSVRISLNGRLVTLAGVHLRGPGPSLGVYLAVIGMLALLGPVVRWTGLPAVLSFAAMLVAAVGGGFAGPHTSLARGAAVVGVLATVLTVAAATSATPRRHRPWVAGGVGVTSAFLASAQLAVLAKPYVNSALPAGIARGLVVSAIGLGLGVGGAALRQRPWRGW